MPRVLPNVLLHRDSESLTYHESVGIPDIVPINIDCNEEMIVGKAHMRRAAGEIYADLHLDHEFPGISDDPHCILGVDTDQTKFFKSEDGTNYLIYGGVRYIAILLLENEIIKKPSEVE
jgi:hypothetical protein